MSKREISRLLSEFFPNLSSTRSYFFKPCRFLPNVTQKVYAKYLKIIPLRKGVTNKSILKRETFIFFQVNFFITCFPRGVIFLNFTHTFWVTLGSYL